MHFSIQSFDDLNRDDWDRLYADSESPNVFYSWKFIKAATLTWDRFRELTLIVGEIDGAMMLAQPIEILKSDREVVVRFFRIIAADGIAPLGMEQNSRREVSSLIEFALSAFSADRVEIASATERLADMVSASFSEARYRAKIKGKGTELQLPGTVDEYWSRMKSDHRSLLKRRIRKADQAGLTFRVIGSGSQSGDNSLPAALSRLTDLHRKRFESMGRQSFFVAEDVQRFHKALAKLSDETGSLEIIECLSGEQAVGSIYGVSSRNDYVCLMTGFDPQYQQLSIGVLLFYKAIERAIEKGLLRFDFKVGAEQYKSWWSKEIYFVYDISVFRKAKLFVSKKGLMRGNYGSRLASLFRRLFLAIGRFTPGAESKGMMRQLGRK